MENQKFSELLVYKKMVNNVQKYWQSAIPTSSSHYSLNMAVASGRAGRGFGPTTFSQTKLAHAQFEYT